MQQSTKNKHTLFYSDSCSRSREVAKLILHKKIRDRFLFVSVEQYQNMLPSFVNTVPLIYTSNSEVLTDDDMILFVRHLSNGASTEQQQLPAPPKDAGMFDPFEITSDLSDSFSFINSSSGDPSDQRPRSFDFIQPEGGNRSSPPPVPNNNNNTPSSRNHVLQPQKNFGALSSLPEPIKTRRNNEDFATELDRMRAMREGDIKQNAPRVM